MRLSSAVLVIGCATCQHQRLEDLVGPYDLFFLFIQLEKRKKFQRGE